MPNLFTKWGTTVKYRLIGGDRVKNISFGNTDHAEKAAQFIAQQRHKWDYHRIEAHSGSSLLSQTTPQR